MASRSRPPISSAGSINGDSVIGRATYRSGMNFNYNGVFPQRTVNNIPEKEYPPDEDDDEEETDRGR
jgi:hypothetical protein